MTRVIVINDDEEMKSKDDELVITYIVHGGNPKNCRRCQNSIRPPCIECGHTLSATIKSIDGLKYTTCEYCYKHQNI